ncbi:MAG TPA: stage 0 sporulation protein [Nitrospiraceae bacterium]|jgi:cell fate regulator YaaT (PSP1 superfamily)|nr:stage 0 sporulation protein [Nitrospiraceae bacterium]
MPDVVGIRFKTCGKIYDFEVNGIEVARGDLVVVESELGLSMGNVVVERHTRAEGTKELKKLLRKASEADLNQKSENKALEEEAMSYCIERITARGLPMKMIYTEVTLDKKRFIFYFTADGRIDFRELVKDLAAKFKTRIEMRQIGVRDATKTVGGLGICGRELCCKTFLTSFEPISIRMAKSQELVLNANKLSGVCGRLMCCLSYEYSDSDTLAEKVQEGEAMVPRGEGVKDGDVVGEGDSLADAEERTEKHVDRSKGLGTEQKNLNYFAVEGEIQRTPGKQNRFETSEGASDGLSRKSQKDTGQPGRTEKVSAGNEGDKRRFHKRKRSGRRFRK